MHFEIIGEIESIETIASGGRIRDIMRLRKQYGSAKWRKLKGIAKVRLQGGSVRNAEIHWYEAHEKPLSLSVNFLIFKSLCGIFIAEVIRK